ncbi:MULTISPECIES: hypothetical protein [Methylobacterium]|jgi:hypothetical protein|uniref:Uncharacterized protein n=2 Tax=Methylobacterium TaxID=407 RepID=A0AAE8L9N6_9HYPH|nr:MULTISPECIES: hypothetical protein [unclassified Methylobacterium]APT29902.1 hypothetical protein MCBMB27_00611 [Methylobacterium phyllosphaerae]KOX44405.1 hypothetical protein ADL19_26055 [Streptomyces purpurogeneiscleroticus]MBP30561.1 hypothetical protein [Methylobacterium sp.]SFH69165.1 hypothetical protein SAMN05192567_14516 [Methylobacterium phyllosphaerae]SFV14561.1 hypothetical protein SAMN02799643_06122 [Methylobacterium sp. UNCCL125]
MDENGLERLRMIAGAKADTASSQALIRIAQSLDLPIEAFYQPDRCGPATRPAIDWETERLLALVKVHFRQLDPAARRRFGEAVLGMVGSEPAEG